jgi:hypothetical protein
MASNRDPIIVESHDNGLAVFIAIAAIVVIILLVAVVAFMGGTLLWNNDSVNNNPGSPATTVPATNAPAQPTDMPLPTPQGLLSSAAFS